MEYYSKAPSKIGHFLVVFVFGGIITYFAMEISFLKFNSRFLGLILGVIAFLVYFIVQANKNAKIVMSDEGIFLNFLFPMFKSNLKIPYSSVVCVYFFCAPFGLNSPSIIIKYKLEKRDKQIIIGESSPILIEKLLNTLNKLHGIKIGISKESVNYLGLKERLPIIENV